MKSIINQTLLLAICACLMCFLILNQGMISGVILAGIFLLIGLALFSASVIGVVKGRLNFMKLKTTAEAISLMILSILLTVAVASVTIINSFVVYVSEFENQGPEDKIRYFASAVFQVSSQAELLKTEKNGVVYFYSRKNEDEIAKVDEVLQRERKNFNSFLGTQDEGGLMVEFHEDYDSLESSYGAEEIAGYYNLGNKSIHLVPTDENWELILVHEYSHYQSHLFSNQNGLSITRLPSWFEEGIADYFADDSIGWYDLESIELIDFHDLDSQQDFDGASTSKYDPYAQSFLAIGSLVEEHGEELILELLESQSIGSFYKKLEAMMGMEIEEYQKVFLKGMIAEQQQMNNWFDLAYEQLDRKDYDALQKTAASIKREGDIYDIDSAEWLLVDALLAQGKFEDAAALLNRKIVADPEEFLDYDLFLLAEVYLLIDPKLALETALKAEEAKQNSSDYYYEEDLIAIYEKLNTDNAKEGYRELLEEEWLYNPYVLDHLKDKLDKEYPGEF